MSHEVEADVTVHTVSITVDITVGALGEGSSGVNAGDSTDMNGPVRGDGTEVSQGTAAQARNDLDPENWEATLMRVLFDAFGNHIDGAGGNFGVGAVADFLLYSGFAMKARISAGQVGAFRLAPDRMLVWTGDAGNAGAAATHGVSIDGDGNFCIGDGSAIGDASGTIKCSHVVTNSFIAQNFFSLQSVSAVRIGGQRRVVFSIAANPDGAAVAGFESVGGGLIKFTQGYSGDGRIQVAGINVTSESLGSVTLTAGTATVSNLTVTANSLIFLQRATAGGTVGELTYTISAGVSFTINSSSVSDTSTINYFILEPAS